MSMFKSSDDSHWNVLLTYYAIHRDKVVKASCVCRNTAWTSNKCSRAFTIKTQGLCIGTHVYRTLQTALHRKHLYLRGYCVFRARKQGLWVSFPFWSWCLTAMPSLIGPSPQRRGRRNPKKTCTKTTRIASTSGDTASDAMYAERVRALL